MFLMNKDDRFFYRPPKNKSGKDRAIHTLRYLKNTEHPINGNVSIQYYALANIRSKANCACSVMFSGTDISLIYSLVSIDSNDQSKYGNVIRFIVIHEHR